MLFGCVLLVNFLERFFVLAHVAIFSIKKARSRSGRMQQVEAELQKNPGNMLIIRLNVRLTQLPVIFTTVRYPRISPLR
jgi:hypothetical protein